MGEPGSARLVGPAEQFQRLAIAVAVIVLSVAMPGHSCFPLGLHALLARSPGFGVPGVVLVAAAMGAAWPQPVYSLLQISMFVNLLLATSRLSNS